MIGIIIQARLGSSRLPGKVLFPLMGKPVLWHVVNRLRHSKFAEKIIVATSNNLKDSGIVTFCNGNDIDCFRGDEDDVLLRYHLGAQQYGLKTIVRITADCPLIDPEVMDNTIQFHLNEEAEYTTNRLVPTFPVGLDVDVIDRACLERVNSLAKKKSEREHVVPYIWNHSSEFVIREYRSDVDYSNYRWVLDYGDDYELIKKIYEPLYAKEKIFLMHDIMKLCEKNPEWLRSISHIQRHEGYLKSLKEDKKDGI